ncbi:LysE/ArgO family amino acid transporter [Desulfovibrio subterraneus]|uniref:LysE/ArgO family amino acid transporter n=1 Tax=Desulfovibrio subterraneus TaxID=2718620 RepID=UPI0022B910EA|nr:LysE/ArgO family amino acid transporter [Desulfovibrio subterraneus]WBF66980.1 LysE/ArgO family amino acid transporter [Desulfovibrio subterraneus]
MLGTYIQGMGMGGSLIIAIGAQNAFVFSQGVRQNHPLTIALLCSLCDAILICLGVTGVGTAVAASPVLGRYAALFGAAFLLWYGLGAMRSMLRGGCLKDDAACELTTRRSAVAATLAVTLLNPHVYLDTVVLLGAVSGQYVDDARYVFGAGAATASFLWFFSLSFGGRMMAPFFRSQTAWKVLDGVVCLTMWYIGAGLLMRGLA